MYLLASHSFSYEPLLYVSAILRELEQLYQNLFLFLEEMLIVSQYIG